jgi:endonuclease/exonuclease/phosphatase family metal-dependent hydrolase
MHPVQFLAVLCLLAACADDVATPFDPTVEPNVTLDGDASGPITIMTRNLYVGADVDAVIAALASPDPSDDVAALVTAVATLRQTDYARRAAAFADEIARTRPHAIGLQEVSSIDLVIPPLGIEVHLNFLPVLLAELTARGLSYEVAALGFNFEAAPMPGVRLIDEDALLVDGTRVTVHDTASRRFSANLGPVAPGVALVRGWVSAAVTIADRSYLIVSTHLESGAAPGLDQLRGLQAAELAQAVAGAPRVILMGDLNDVPGSPMYQALAGAAYVDVWSALRQGAIGYTCCHLPDLSNQVEQFDERIDYVLARGFDGPNGKLRGKVFQVGHVSAERISGPEYPIWPSDHAGLVARLDPADAVP